MSWPFYTHNITMHLSHEQAAVENSTWLQPQEPGLAPQPIPSSAGSSPPGKQPWTNPGLCLITWQIHSRMLNRFPSRPRPAPQTALLCLTGQVSHLELKKKKQPPSFQQRFVKPHELCPLPPSPGRDRIWQEMPAPSMPWAALSPFNTSDQPKKLLSSWTFEGDFSTSTEKENFSCNAVCVAAMQPE